jgi:hypothetical protein
LEIISYNNNNNNNNNNKPPFLDSTDIFLFVLYIVFYYSAYLGSYMDWTEHNGTTEPFTVPSTKAGQ